MTLVKICGLTSESMVRHALESGADRVGFVAVAASPRHVGFEQIGRLAAQASRMGREAWVVAAWSRDGAGPHVSGLAQFVRETPAITAVQLHGRETADDVADFRERVAGRSSPVRIAKAVGVSEAIDLEGLARFAAADALLLDAKPPKGATYEGGHGKPFDWSILGGFVSPKPWMLSGGLTPENVADAIRITGATEVDVSSGVESAPGLKDPAKVAAFIAAVRGAG